MAVQALAAVAVVAIAFYQSVRGLFSAMLMTILTVICTLLAFGFYEPLARWLLYTRQPATADAIMLIALFVIPLLVLRLVFDKFIAQEISLGVWPDRIIGGALGLLTGILAAGVLTIAIQMLPFGKSVLTFRPFDDALNRRQSLAPFYSDQFTTGLVDIASAGSLSGNRRFGNSHDNLTLELFCARNRAGKKGRIDALPDSLSIFGAYEISQHDIKGMDRIPPAPLLPSNAPTKPVVIRTGISEQARGENDWWRLPGTHFRLVGPDGQSHYPVGFLTYVTEQKVREEDRLNPGWKFFTPPEKDNQWQYADLLVARPWSHKGGPKVLTVDWVYQLPAGKDEGYYMVFRRVARASVPKISGDMPFEELRKLSEQQKPQKPLYRNPASWD